MSRLRLHRQGRCHSCSWCQTLCWWRRLPWLLLISMPSNARSACTAKLAACTLQPVLCGGRAAVAGPEQDVQQIQGNGSNHRSPTFVTADAGCYKARHPAHKCCMCAQPVYLHIAAHVSATATATAPTLCLRLRLHITVIKQAPMPAAGVLASLTALQVTQYWVSSTTDKLVDLLHQATMSGSMVAAEGTVLDAWRCLVSLAHDLLSQAAEAGPASRDGASRGVSRHLVLRLMPLVQQGPLSRRLAFTGEPVGQDLHADSLRAPQDLSEAALC